MKTLTDTEYIHALIAEGEHQQQDFKFEISDARKIARSISAFANNDGGRLLIGVKDNGVIAGVKNEEDIYVVEEAASLYCSPEIELRFTAFRVDGGLTVIRAEIEAAADRRPVMVCEADGRMRAYYRVADENIAAPDLMVRSWRESSTGQLLRLTDAERSAMTLLDSCGYLTAESLATHAAISVSTASDIIISLHAMGLVKWSYSGGTFRLVAVG